MKVLEKQFMEYFQGKERKRVKVKRLFD